MLGRLLGRGQRADARSLQLRVLRLGLLQDGDVGVGLFPARGEVRVIGKPTRCNRSVKRGSDLCASNMGSTLSANSQLQRSSYDFVSHSNICSLSPRPAQTTAMQKLGTYYSGDGGRSSRTNSLARCRFPDWAYACPSAASSTGIRPAS
jgi:hypothetical protein